MLDQTPLNSLAAQATVKLHAKLEDDWQLGDAPCRWDVSFTDRLWIAVSRWFARDAEAASVKLAGPVLRQERRRAA